MQKRILVVDDEKVFRECVLEFLEEWGYQGFEAKDGKEAELMIVNYELSGRRPNLVISDIEMPGHPNGLELCQHITLIYPNIKVITMSANPEAYEDLAKAAGCNAFFPKPLNFLELEQSIKRILS